MRFSHLLLVTDLFGHTPAIDSLLRQLPLPCTVLSPWAPDAPVPRDARQAHTAFLAQGGLASYVRSIQNCLRTLPEEPARCPILGFSVGASAAWQVCAQPGEHERHSFLFYGSRIHALLHRAPPAHTRLVFAEREPGFDASALVRQLHSQGYLAQLARNTTHGFMNPYSQGFDVEASQHYLAWLQHHLRAPLSLVSQAA